MEIEIYKIKEIDEVSSRVLKGVCEHPRLLGNIFSEWYHHLTFMSTEQIKNNILESISLAKETLVWKKNGTLQKRINSLQDYLSKNTYDRRILMTIVTNTILSAEGFSNLKR